MLRKTEVLDGDNPSLRVKMNTSKDNMTTEEVTGYAQINLSSSVNGYGIGATLVETSDFLLGEVFNCS